ncbi:MAG TPA: TIR domain-containing protein, partial [Pyrinomonadaceae bacterium]|nr:TIR domain-containing protein [Pyrinomonadaceae bacterium]
MPITFSYDVFLSYNHQDKLRVRRLAERLREAELRVWFDEWNIRAGEIISLKVDEGLEQSCVLVLCVSPNALASNWVALERSTAIHRDPSNEGRRFIPLLLTDSELPDTLRRYKYIDFRDETDAAFTELLTACRTETEEQPAVKSTTREEIPRDIDEHQTLRITKSPLAVFERELNHGDWVTSVAISPDGTRAVSGSRNKVIKIWDLKSGKCRNELRGHTSDVKVVAFTPDGKRIVSGSNDETVRVWDANSGREIATLRGHTLYVRALATLANNSQVLSAQDVIGSDGSLKLWDLDSASCLMTIQYSKYAGGAFSCAVNRQGTRAISGHRDGRLCLWDLESGELVRVTDGHSKIVGSIQLSRDERYAISGSDDSTIKIWELESGRGIGTLEGHTNSVDSLAISSDGGLIASTGFQDYSVRLWDWNAGICRDVIDGKGKGFTPLSVAFSPTGSQLLVGTFEGKLYLYSIKSDAIQPTDSRRYVNA